MRVDDKLDCHPQRRSSGARFGHLLKKPEHNWATWKSPHTQERRVGHPRRGRPRAENRRTQSRPEIGSGPPVMAARVATEEAIGSAFKRDVLRQSTSVMSTDPLAPLART